MKKLMLPISLVLIVLIYISCNKAGPEEPEGLVNTVPQTSLLKESGLMFTGEEDHSISLKVALEMMSAFQENNPYNAYSWYFDRDAIEILLFQEECVGIRIYGGLDNSAQFSPVIFGVTPDGKDIKGDGDGLFKTQSDSTVVGPMELAYPCPPMC